MVFGGHDLEDGFCDMLKGSSVEPEQDAAYWVPHTMQIADSRANDSHAYCASMAGDAHGGTVSDLIALVTSSRMFAVHLAGYLPKNLRLNMNTNNSTKEFAIQQTVYAHSRWTSSNLTPEVKL
jgi:hypothetical protein